MIAILPALLLQAAPATEKSFAFMCRLQGTLEPKKELSSFPNPRPLGFLVQRTAENAFTPMRTFDPSLALNGRQIRIFRGFDTKSKSYGAYTSLPSQDSGTMVLSITASDSDKYNEWTVAIGQHTAGSTPPLTMGKCLLMDGIGEQEFAGLTDSIRAQTNTKGEVAGELK